MFDFSKIKRKLQEAERKTGPKVQRLATAFVQAAPHPTSVILAIGIGFLAAEAVTYPGKLTADLRAFENEIFDGMGEAYTTSAAFLRARGFCMHVRQGSDATQAPGCANQMAQSESRPPPIKTFDPDY